MRRFVVAAAMIGTFVVPSAFAQEQPRVGGVTAQTLRLEQDVLPILVLQLVTAEMGAPVAGAQVFLYGTSIGGLSNADGFVELPIPEAGTWTVGVRLIGSHEVRAELRLARGTATQVLVGLTEDETALGDGIHLAPPLYEGRSRSDTLRATRLAGGR